MVNEAVPKHIFVLVPNIFGFKGGVQVYSSLLIQAIQKVYPQAKYSVFLKYEQVSPSRIQQEPFLPQTRFYPFGEIVCDTNNWRRRFRTFLSAATIFWNAFWCRPDLIVTTEINYYVVLCHRLRQWFSIPYLVVLHGIEAWDIKKSAYQQALAGAQRIIAVSHYTRNRVFSEGYLRAEQLRVLPNTFDSNRFRVQPKPDYLLKRYGLSENQPILLTVTRLQKFAHYKGYDKVLRVLGKVRQHVPDAHYVLVGKGDDRDRVESMIRDLNLQGCVTLTGFVTDEELPDHYSLCDVFVMPSKGEGFGIVYLEALSAGKPILAGNQDGSVDPLLNGKLGCLVDPDNEDEIAQQLINILTRKYSDSRIYDALWLREEVCKNFEIARFNRLTKEYIRESIEENQRKYL